MQPLKVFVVPRETVEMLCGKPPIPQADLDKYLYVRPGILDSKSCDIFQPNCRSHGQARTNFALFSIQDHVESGTTVVFPFWMELFESFGDKSHIGKCIDWLNATYPHNPKVIQWNHDRDQATVPELQDLPENMFVLTYNTSRPNPTDIVLPFWNVDTQVKWDAEQDRQFRGGFIGHIGNIPVRRRMKESFSSRSEWFIADATDVRYTQDTYLGHMKQFDFALCPRGGGLSSYRFYEAIQCGCIPILFADHVALPYPDLDWGSFICRIPEADAGDFNLIWDMIGGIDIKERRRIISDVRHRLGLSGVQSEIHKRIYEWLN